MSVLSKSSARGGVRHRQRPRPRWPDRALFYCGGLDPPDRAAYDPVTGQAVKGGEPSNSTRYRRILPPNSHPHPIVVETLLYH